MAKHFSTDIYLKGRASFDLSVHPAILTIDPVKEEDDMEYRCRVDYRWGRTANTHVKLDVVGK